MPIWNCNRGNREAQHLQFAADHMVHVVDGQIGVRKAFGTAGEGEAASRRSAQGGVGDPVLPIDAHPPRIDRMKRAYLLQIGSQLAELGFSLEPAAS